MVLKDFDTQLIWTVEKKLWLDYLISNHVIDRVINKPLPSSHYDLKYCYTYRSFTKPLLSSEDNSNTWVFWNYKQRSHEISIYLSKNIYIPVVLVHYCSADEPGTSKLITGIANSKASYKARIMKQLTWAITSRLWKALL